MSDFEHFAKTGPFSSYFMPFSRWHPLDTLSHKAQTARASNQPRAERRCDDYEEDENAVAEIQWDATDRY